MSISRTYRPQIFADITGQFSIRETLRKEVATKAIGHAYLFSGPRGVGKTTTARIFAKALHCLNPNEGEPCTTCAACMEAQEHRALDVIELDAASNTGVDMVRESIIEHVRFAPTSRPYKVYILDEAHMLSTAAWNALLKTLEEPPSYAVFILATTEFHKVPATIISRCQRFDFKRLTDEELRERITGLAKKEHIEIADAVVASIARHADGCVRDAETLLDQLLALGEKKITEEVATLVLPVSRLPRAAELLKIASTRDLAATFNGIARLQDDGIPLTPFFQDCLDVVRELLWLSGDAKRLKRLQDGDETERAVAAIHGVFSPAELADIALVFLERRKDVKQGIDPQFALELAFAPIALRLLPHATTDAKVTETPPPAERATLKVAPTTETIKITETPKTMETTQPSQIPGELTLALVQRKWQRFLQAVDDRNKSFPIILRVCRPHDVHGNVVMIAFQYPFHQEKIIGNLKNKRVIDEAMAEALGIAGVIVDGVVITQKENDAAPKVNDVVSNLLNAFGGHVVSEGENP